MLARCCSNWVRPDLGRLARPAGALRRFACDFVGVGATKVTGEAPQGVRGSMGRQRRRTVPGMSAMRSWTPLAWAGTVVLALALAACAQPPAQLLDWRPVEVTGVSAPGVAPDAVIVGLAADAAKGQAPGVLVCRAGLSSPVEVLSLIHI